MSIGTSIGLGLAVAGGIGAAGSIAGAAISGSAAKSAASTEASAAKSAQQIQEQEFEQEQQNLSPYLQTGTSALSQLSNLAPFAAPTAAEAAATPGYQFELQQGNLALDNNLVAKGITGGNAGEAISQYNEGLASTDYSNTYNEALQTYSTNEGRLSTLANMGLSATNSEDSAAQNYATQAGNDLTSAASATAAGTVGEANAWSSGISGATSSVANAALLNQLLGNGGGTAAANNSSYSVGQQMSAGQGLTTNMGTLTPAQLAAYSAGSTPAGYIDANGNPIQ